jgi:hypothetical protein
MNCAYTCLRRLKGRPYKLIAPIGAAGICEVFRGRFATGMRGCRREVQRAHRGESAEWSVAARRRSAHPAGWRSAGGSAREGQEGDTFTVPPSLAIRTRDFLDDRRRGPWEIDGQSTGVPFRLSIDRTAFRTWATVLGARKVASRPPSTLIVDTLPANAGNRRSKFCSQSCRYFVSAHSPGAPLE